MGLTKSSVGKGAIDKTLTVRPSSPDERVIALAGNPNVGKSTVFNALTGMHQHTGNWPGKTVANAAGSCKSRQNSYLLVDIPGTYSLLAHSAEEEVARDFICFGSPDAAVVVCDATCLERNLNLVLQIMECGARVVVCVNLMDEARRKGIKVDLARLSERLGVPVVGTVARKKKTLRDLTDALDAVVYGDAPSKNCVIPYPEAIEDAIAPIVRVLQNPDLKGLSPRWLALRLLDADESLLQSLKTHLGEAFLHDPALVWALANAKEVLRLHGLDRDGIEDLIVSSAVRQAEVLCRGVVRHEQEKYDRFDRRLDAILTGRITAYPVMLLLLALIFWLTLTVSNIPSAWLSDKGFWLIGRLAVLLENWRAPPWLIGVLTDGILRVLVWVISVMLPPMAIFFPLFTLLEDAGYLPRVAYNLDGHFQRCHACGKQALTLCMGFGCNAAGVVGCRIIDSPRERMLAILTNSFVPCNGRFPTLIAVLTMFFVGFSGSFGASVVSSLLLTSLILLGILATFWSTKLLSKTWLRGMPSSFALELPPYRPPQIGKVLVRSIFDRTLFVLGRSVAVAAPAGLIIWLLANLSVGGATLLGHCTDFLDPFARVLGMDGVILMAFILGFPANEIVIPIMIMTYLSQGTLTELSSLTEMKALFVSNGWTWATAVCVLLFMLMHWPCSTTLLTIKKETGSIKWTLIAALLPTAFGMLACLLFTAIVRGFGMV